MRYPLIDGQGNFGNIDGDNAAAYRYAGEADRPCPFPDEGLDKDTVDFEETTMVKSENWVLPAAFPALLANGVGIAVKLYLYRPII